MQTVYYSTWGLVAFSGDSMVHQALRRTEPFLVGCPHPVPLSPGLVCSGGSQESLETTFRPLLQVLSSLPSCTLLPRSLRPTHIGIPGPQTPQTCRSHCSAWNAVPPGSPRLLPHFLQVFAQVSPPQHQSPYLI
jgi:hypothetical protein